jgi:hypothetical protein
MIILCIDSDTDKILTDIPMAHPPAILRHDWSRSPQGKAPWPLAVSLVLFPLLLVWTFPQSLGGLLYACYHRARGGRFLYYRFGPFIYLVVPIAPFRAQGISLGLVVFANRPEILIHEFCHTYTALWLSWLYLPIYGLEYLVFGHDASPHERLTRHFEHTCRQTWTKLGRSQPAHFFNIKT